MGANISLYFLEVNYSLLITLDVNKILHFGQKLMTKAEIFPDFSYEGAWGSRHFPNRGSGGKFPQS